jgi:hypothetical protein
MGISDSSEAQYRNWYGNVYREVLDRYSDYKGVLACCMWHKCAPDDGCSSTLYCEWAKWNKKNRTITCLVVKTAKALPTDAFCKSFMINEKWLRTHVFTLRLQIDVQNMTAIWGWEFDEQFSFPFFDAETKKLIAKRSVRELLRGKALSNRKSALWKKLFRNPLYATQMLRTLLWYL